MFRIEPITITARHPFGFGRCKDSSRKEYSKYFGRNVPRAGRSDVDYVLLQSGIALYNYTHTRTGKRANYENVVKNGSGNKKNKHYLFDAGTSTFDSSLFWFTCGYSQV